VFLSPLPLFSLPCAFNFCLHFNRANLNRSSFSEEKISSFHFPFNGICNGKFCSDEGIHLLPCMHLFCDTCYLRATQQNVTLVCDICTEGFRKELDLAVERVKARLENDRNSVTQCFLGRDVNKELLERKVLQEYISSLASEQRRYPLRFLIVSTTDKECFSQLCV